MILHAIFRGLLHFGLSTVILVWSLFFFRLLAEWKKQWKYIPRKIKPQLIFLSAIIVVVTFFREPFDVGFVGDPVWKSYTDLASWILGVSMSSWIIRWLVKLDWD